MNIDALDEAIGKLSAAALQIAPSDDQIIAGHVRDSVALLLRHKNALKGNLSRLSCLKERIDPLVAGVDADPDDLIIGPVALDEPSLLDKAIEMRNAIDAIELALHVDDDLSRIVERFDGVRDSVIVRPKITLRELRQIVAALAICNDIMHSPDFSPANL